MLDGEFADLLMAVKDTEQFRALEKIICVNKNELGPNILAAIDLMLDNKEQISQLSHLCFTNCKLRVGSIFPLLKTLHTRTNTVKTLIIPRQNFGAEAVKTLCDLIKSGQSMLKTLDISWNKLT